MIKLSKLEGLEEGLHCTTCREERDVKKLEFENNGSSTVVRLCKKCRAELRNELNEVVDESGFR